MPVVLLPYLEGTPSSIDIQEVAKAKLFKEMIQAWMEEDSKLSIEEKELLSKASEEDLGLAMHRDLEEQFLQDR